MLGSGGASVWEGGRALAQASRTAGGRGPRRKGSSDGNNLSGVRVGSRKVLLIGRIRELALYRSEYLRGKGFSVIAPTGKAEVLQAIESGGFDIAVLTYTLSSESVLEFAELVRQHCPTCPVIIITNTGQSDRRVAPDAVVVADDGPEALLAALRRVADRRVH